MADGPVCIISNALPRKPTLLIVVVALLLIATAVSQTPHTPPLNTNRAADPDIFIPVFVAGPDNDATPNMVQLLHSTNESLSSSAVPLLTKRHSLNPYELGDPPEQFTPVRKFNIRTLLKVEKLPALKEIPVAKGAED
jgi:hypothetical protein